MAYKYLDKSNGRLVFFPQEIDVGSNIDINGKLHYLIDNGNDLLIEPSLGEVFAYPYPSQLSNTCLWLDAADSSTFTMGTGDLFSQWTDKSVLGTNHAIQIDSGKQATIGATTQNGLNVTTWNGSASIYRISGLTITNNHSIYVAGKTNGNGYSTILRGEPATAETIHFGAGSGNSNLCTFYGDGITWDSTQAQNLPAASIASPCIMAGNAPGDGTSIPSVNCVAQNQLICSLNYTDFWLGGAISTQFWNGLIYEIVISCGVLTSTEQARLCNYLNTKWGLGLSL